MAAPTKSDDPGDRGHRRRRPRHRVLRIAAFVVTMLPLLALAAIFAVIIYARTDAGRERVRAMVLAQVHQQVPGLHIGHIDGDYVHALALRDVHIDDREGRRAIAAERIFVRFRLWPLVRHRVQIDELRVESPRVLGRPGKSGALNLTELTSPAASPGTEQQPRSSPAPEWTIAVDRIVISDGRVDIAMPEAQAIELRKIDVSGGFLAAGDSIAASVDASVDGATPAPLLISARGKGTREQMAVNLDVTIAPEGRERGQPQVTLAGRLGLVTSPSADGAATLGAYDLTLRLSELDPAALALKAPAGSISAQLTARGHGVPLEPDSDARLVLDLAPSRSGNIALPASRVVVETEGPAWRVPPVTLRLPGAEARLQGKGRDHDLDVSASVTLGGPRGLLPRGVGIPATATALKGRGRLEVTVSGRYPDRLSVAARGGVTGFAAGQLQIKQASLSANVRGLPSSPRGQVRLGVRDLRTGGADAVAVDTLTANLDADGHKLHVTAAVAGKNVRGGLDARATMTAGNADITVDRLSLAVTTAMYRQELALQQPAAITFKAGDRITLGPTQLRGKGYRLTGDVLLEGTYDLSSSDRSSDRSSAHKRREPLAQVAVSARKASFNGLDAIDADLRATVESKRTRLSLNARVAHARLSLDADLPVLVPRQGSPRLARKGPIGVTLKSDQIKLEELPVLHKLLARNGVSGGTLDLSASVTGDISAPSVKADFAASNLMLRNVSGSGRDSTIKTISGVGGRLALDTRPGSIQLGGQVLLRKTGLVTFDLRSQTDLGAIIAGKDPLAAPLTGTVDIPKFNLASLAEYTDRAKGVEGTLVGHATLGGSPRRPSGSAEVNITNARVDAVKFQQIALAAEARDGHVKGRFTMNQAGGGTLSAAGELRRAQGDTLSATLNAKDLDVGFLRLMTPTVRDLGGHLNLWASANGPLASPTVRAGADLRNGQLGLIGQPTFRDLALTLALAPGRADLTRLHMRSGDGTLTGKGWALLDGLRPTSMVFTAHADRFLVAAAGSTGARLEGDIAIEAALRESVVDGKVRVPHAVVWLPKVSAGGGRNLQRIGPRADLRFIDPAALAAEEKQRDQAKADARKPTVLDIKAQAGPVYVRSKDLDIEVESTMTVTTVQKGPARGKPSLTGAIHIRRGHINISGQRFNFDRGDITFNGDPELNPALDIRITHDYPDATVVVLIGGTPKSPKLKLTSDPPIYDEAQIVSLILTGQPGGQPSSGKSIDPTAAVATLVLGKLADKLAPELGLDVLRVEKVDEKSAEGSATGGTDTRIEVGKYISERIYLSYAHVFGATETQNANEAHVEYRITRRWIAETVFGDAGVGGIDALWTYRY